MMEHHIDISFDKDLENVTSLTWLPWIGKDFKENERKLLIVGESHYALADNDDIYQNSFQENTQNKKFTREIIYESPVCGDWRNNTYDNMHRALLRSNDFDKKCFWEQVAFYNFIPRLMDYRVKERPTSVDFYSSWKTFIELITILKPTDCIFIGVSASNTFNDAMKNLNINYTPINWLEGIGTAYARTATLDINENKIKLSFIQHTSAMFSWSEWNNFLARENEEILIFLKAKVLNEHVEFIPSEIIEMSEETIPTVNVPMDLSHKPIIACDYIAYTKEEEDAKYLSIGHSTFNHDEASIKVFRHTGNMWSRQSEELPINRVGDLALLLLTAMKKVKNPSSEQSILNEVTVKDDELEFLSAAFENNKERIKRSFLEIKKILNDFDIENF
jgi:hypothetical protein